jgi:hypothetical protein
VKETPDKRFAVWRQDDNGNRARIAVLASEEEARRLADELEARGHKQLYWVEEE